MKKILAGLVMVTSLSTFASQPNPRALKVVTLDGGKDSWFHIYNVDFDVDKVRMVYTINSELSLNEQCMDHLNAFKISTNQVKEDIIHGILVLDPETDVSGTCIVKANRNY